MPTDLINLYSMGRSGTHAIINWIAGHTRCIFVFTMRRTDLISNTSYIDIFVVKDGKVNKSRTKINIGSLPKLIAAYGPQKFVFVADPFCINQSVVDDHNAKVVNFFCKGNKKVRVVANIVLLRSPWNHYASILQWQYKTKLKNNPRKFAKYWMSYALEYLGTSNFLSDKVPINYDRWFMDLKYRKLISEKLNMSFSDIGLNCVDWEGHGSSFDFVNFNQRAQDMKVLERWKVIDKNSENYIKFKAMMGTRGLVKIALLSFGYLPKGL